MPAPHPSETTATIPEDVARLYTAVKSQLRDPESFRVLQSLMSASWTAGWKACEDERLGIIERVR